MVVKTPIKLPYYSQVSRHEMINIESGKAWEETDMKSTSAQSRDAASSNSVVF